MVERQKNQEQQLDTIKVAKVERVSNDRGVLPKDFTLPDFTIPKGKDRHSVEVKFPLLFRDKEWQTKLLFELQTPDKFGPVLAKISFDILDPEDKDSRISHFATTLFKKDSIHAYEYRDQREKRAALIYYRNVENKKYRKQGLGELSLKIVEEVLRKINTERPALRMEVIQVTTNLGILSRLLVSKEWLVKHGVEPTSDRDLGYVPHPADEAKALRLLKKQSSDPEDIQPNDPTVLFLKDMI